MSPGRSSASYRSFTYSDARSSPCPTTARIRDGITQSIADQLRRLNSEFAHYTPLEHQLPRVTLHQIGDPEYASSDIAVIELEFSCEIPGNSLKR